MAETKTMPMKKQPERKCVGCNEKKPKKELVRVVRTPDGTIVLDKTGKLSGRGVYLCKNPVCLQKAVKAHRLGNALECEIPDTVMNALDAALHTQEE